ncbi:hypothetical protein [Inmirania thermothiophila]|uniref:Lysozyme inhibitor LprI N-terminal domain-containing protein n=1 Tax=Inmirania thermothiophila TaxID=1750597 RepID=A0A3N1Y3W9_9GAMM|nr:hypothetical protein [Inmirania thermothiophila]ROR32302.1 hypothetical protein EDC57_1500 [Inmirania thermothiophila]
MRGVVVTAVLLACAPAGAAPGGERIAAARYAEVLCLEAAAEAELLSARIARDAGLAGADAVARPAERRRRLGHLEGALRRALPGAVAPLRPYLERRARNLGRAAWMAHLRGGEGAGAPAAACGSDARALYRSGRAFRLLAEGGLTPPPAVTLEAVRAAAEARIGRRPGPPPRGAGGPP